MPVEETKSTEAIPKKKKKKSKMATISGQHNSFSSDKEATFSSSFPIKHLRKGDSDIIFGRINDTYKISVTINIIVEGKPTSSFFD